MAMAELHRLLDVLVRACDVIRTRDENGRENQAADDDQQPGKTELRKRVRAATENLRHWMLGGAKRTTAGSRRFPAANPGLYHVVKKGSSKRRRPSQAAKQRKLVKR